MFSIVMTSYFGDLPFIDFPNYIGILVIVLSLIGLLKSKLGRNYKIYFLVTLNTKSKLNVKN